VNGDVKLGQLLCDADVITKRQLSKALGQQVKGNKKTIGEILVDMGVCTLDDITDTLINGQQEKAQPHIEKHEEIHNVVIPITKPEPVPIPQPVVEVVPEPVKEEPVEISEEKVMGTKFSMSVQTIVGLITLISTAVGGYYMLLQEIEEAKQLPEINVENIFSDEYPSKPDGHNWPRSYEQYKNQVGGLQEDMDAVYETLDEYEELIKELRSDIKDLERRKKDK
jgi:hypothetical protein|tara:strand:+ start:118 stop:789 length:672 start_codon:yes stop_codon:yes gene_type:complete